jgi:hypothetical protein
MLSQAEADRRRLSPGSAHNISPYLNPAHFLAPPRRWLEALLQGEYGWHFFRLRYKNLLRNRFREEPERFFGLLDASQGDKPLYLTCHCLSGACHGEIAREFLEILRAQEPYRHWSALRAATLHSVSAAALPRLQAAGG